MTKKVKNNRIYLDDNDVYMREYAKWNKNGYYLSYDELMRIRNYNYRTNNNYWYFSPGAFTCFSDKIISLAGIKSYKYKRVRMRNKPFNNHHIKEGNTYYVVNERIRRLFHILTLTDNNEYKLGILFDACLTNYDIIEYMTRWKKDGNNNNKDRDIVRYYRYKEMELNYVFKYKEDIENKLSKYFYKDVANIINDYLINIYK